MEGGPPEPHELASSEGRTAAEQRYLNLFVEGNAGMTWGPADWHTTSKQEAWHTMLLSIPRVRTLDSEVA